MSLSLGREPSLSCKAGQTPDNLPEDPDDLTEWVPHLPAGTELPAQRQALPLPIDRKHR